MQFNPNNFISYPRQLARLPPIPFSRNIPAVPGPNGAILIVINNNNDILLKKEINERN